MSSVKIDQNIVNEMCLKIEKIQGRTIWSIFKTSFQIQDIPKEKWDEEVKRNGGEEGYGDLMNECDNWSPEFDTVKEAMEHSKTMDGVCPMLVQNIYDEFGEPNSHFYVGDIDENDRGSYSPQQPVVTTLEEAKEYIYYEDEGDE